MAQKRGDMTYINEESGWYDTIGNLYPTQNHIQIHILFEPYTDY